MSMAGFVEKFKKMWDSPDDEYDYDEYEEEESGYEDEYDRDRVREREREQRRAERAERRRMTTDAYSEYEGSNKVVNISANTKIQVVLFKPERFGEETRAIADELIKNRTVVLNLEDTNRDMSRRIIDFLSGCIYAIGGTMQKVGVGIYLCAPKNVNVQGKITEDSSSLDEEENEEVKW